MIKIQEALIDNEFLTNTPNTVFTSFLDQIIQQNNLKLKKEYYIHGLIKYPKWTKDVDLFQYVKKEYLQLLVTGSSYFMFDASTEGFSPIFGEPYFKLLYNNCKKYRVDPENIIFVSSNLRDEDNIVKFSTLINEKSFKVFSFPSFENVVAGNYDFKNQQVNELLDSEIHNLKNNFQNKYLSSLSRVNRPHRTMATFLLCHSSIRNHSLISHNSFENINIESWKHYNLLNDFDNKTIKEWLNQLPLIIDQNNFEKNWALGTDYSSIHRQTLFQIVNETLVDDTYQTSLFYSEKTFRPILFFQPFVIFGQPGINQYLQNLGYKLYDDWFDLSFDQIRDTRDRYNELLKMLSKTVDHLNTLSRDDQIKWRFKNKETLIHNYHVMMQGTITKNKLINFLQTL